MTEQTPEQQRRQWEEELSTRLSGMQIVFLVMFVVGSVIAVLTLTGVLSL